MAQANPEIIHALRDTAARLRAGEEYRWSAMASCNCGHLAQTVTKLSREELSVRARMRNGDWEEQVTAYCPTSGYPLDEVITSMLDLGFTTTDISNLERLTDPRVIRAMPMERRHVRHNQAEDVAFYLCTWADLLEAEYLEAQSRARAEPDFAGWTSAEIQTWRDKNRPAMGTAAAGAPDNTDDGSGDVRRAVSTARELVRV